ncbi:unnamed protein product [Urochloa humidicola]
MWLRPPPIASAGGKASARGGLVVARAGAAPARTGTVAALRPSSLRFPAAGARFAGGGRCGGERGGGGGARLAGAGVDTGLRRPAAPAIKMSPFPSYGGAAVLCLARRADGGAGAGVEGDGAGGDDHGGGGVGAGGDNCNAKKGCALNHLNVKDTEGAAAVGGGGSGDDCAKKGSAFDHGKGMEGAPAGDVGAGGDMGGAGAGLHRRNAGKAGNFTNVPGAPAAGGGGSDRADQAFWYVPNLLPTSCLCSGLRRRLAISSAGHATPPRPCTARTAAFPLLARTRARPSAADHADYNRRRHPFRFRWRERAHDAVP